MRSMRRDKLKGSGKQCERARLAHDLKRRDENLQIADRLQKIYNRMPQASKMGKPAWNDTTAHSSWMKKDRDRRNRELSLLNQEREGRIHQVRSYYSRHKFRTHAQQAEQRRRNLDRGIRSGSYWPNATAAHPPSTSSRAPRRSPRPSRLRVLSGRGEAWRQREGANSTRMGRKSLQSEHAALLDQVELASTKNLECKKEFERSQTLAKSDPLSAMQAIAAQSAFESARQALEKKKQNLQNFEAINPNWNEDKPPTYSADESSLYSSDSSSYCSTCSPRSDSDSLDRARRNRKSPSTLKSERRARKSEWRYSKPPSERPERPDRPLALGQPHRVASEGGKQSLLPPAVAAAATPQAATFSNDAALSEQQSERSKRYTAGPPPKTSRARSSRSRPPTAAAQDEFESDGDGADRVEVDDVYGGYDDDVARHADMLHVDLDRIEKRKLMMEAVLKQRIEKMKKEDAVRHHEMKTSAQEAEVKSYEAELQRLRLELKKAVEELQNKEQDNHKRLHSAGAGAGEGRAKRLRARGAPLSERDVGASYRVGQGGFDWYKGAYRKATILHHSPSEEDGLEDSEEDLLFDLNPSSLIAQAAAAGGDGGGDGGDKLANQTEPKTSAASPAAAAPAKKAGAAQASSRQRSLVHVLDDVQNRKEYESILRQRNELKRRSQRQRLSSPAAVYKINPLRGEGGLAAATAPAPVYDDSSFGSTPPHPRLHSVLQAPVQIPSYQGSFDFPAPALESWSSTSGKLRLDFRSPRSPRGTGGLMDETSDRDAEWASSGQDSSIAVADGLEVDTRNGAYPPHSSVEGASIKQCPNETFSDELDDELNSLQNIINKHPDELLKSWQSDEELPSSSEASPDPLKDAKNYQDGEKEQEEDQSKDLKAHITETIMAEVERRLQLLDAENRLKQKQEDEERSRSIDSLLTALEAKLQDKPEEKENLERQVTLTGEERSASQLNAEEKEEPDMTKVTPAANPPSVDASVSEPKRVSSQISSRVTLRASLPKTSRSMNPICVLYKQTSAEENELFEYVGQTEIIVNNTEPNFSTSINVTHVFREDNLIDLKMLVKVYDATDPSAVDESDLVGESHFSWKELFQVPEGLTEESPQEAHVTNSKVELQPITQTLFKNGAPLFNSSTNTNSTITIQNALLDISVDPRSNPTSQQAILSSHHLPQSESKAKIIPPAHFALAHPLCYTMLGFLAGPSDPTSTASHIQVLREDHGPSEGVGGGVKQLWKPVIRTRSVVGKDMLTFNILVVPSNELCRGDAHKKLLFELRQDSSVRQLVADTGDTSTTLGSLLKGGDEWKEIPLTGSAGTLFVTAKTWMDVTWTILHAYPTPFQPLEEGGSGYQAGVDHGESLLKELTNKEKAVFLGIAIEGSKGDRGELLSLPFSIPMVREVAGKSTEPIGAAPRERASSMQQAGLLGRGRRLVRPRSLLQQFLEERQQLPATTDSEEDVLQLLASLSDLSFSSLACIVPRAYGMHPGVFVLRVFKKSIESEGQEWMQVFESEPVSVAEDEAFVAWQTVCLDFYSMANGSLESSLSFRMVEIVSISSGNTAQPNLSGPSRELFVGEFETCYLQLLLNHPRRWRNLERSCYQLTRDESFTNKSEPSKFSKSTNVFVCFPRIQLFRGREGAGNAPP